MGKSKESRVDQLGQNGCLQTGALLKIMEIIRAFYLWVFINTFGL